MGCSYNLQELLLCKFPCTTHQQNERSARSFARCQIGWAAMDITLYRLPGDREHTEGFRREIFNRLQVC